MTQGYSIGLTVFIMTPAGALHDSMRTRRKEMEERREGSRRNMGGEKAISVGA